MTVTQRGKQYSYLQEPFHLQFITPMNLRGETCTVTYLFRLVHSLLRVRLHLVVGVIGNLGDWLFEDGSRLSNW